MVLVGSIRVFCRVRPKIKEDGGGVMGNIVVDYDRDDNGLIYVNNKGRSQTFELDLIFTPESTQNQVGIYKLRCYCSSYEGFKVTFIPLISNMIIYSLHCIKLIFSMRFSSLKRKEKISTTLYFSN